MGVRIKIRSVSDPSTSLRVILSLSNDDGTRMRVGPHAN
jgi:hypothetical protein